MRSEEWDIPYLRAKSLVRVLRPGNRTLVTHLRGIRAPDPPPHGAGFTGEGDVGD